MVGLYRERTLDSTLALFREGYEFVSNRCRRYGTDVFETRLMLEPAICMRGESAARLFYDGEHFTRRGAMPPTALRLLQDKESVQTLDDEAHAHRKRMFMSLMGSDSIGRMVAYMDRAWREAIPSWVEQERIVLFPEVRKILCRAVCRWAGVPLAPWDAAQKAADLGALIDGAGSPVGPRFWRGAAGRTRLERWARELVRDLRSGDLQPGEDTALHVIGWHRDRDGRLLDVDVAAVELLNILRPTVAVGRYIVFVALALHDYPGYRERLVAGDDEEVERFVQEVRRYYPFFPVIAGRVRKSFQWNGIHFPEGRRVLLDMYGTDRDAKRWPDAERFRPERFLDWDGSAFNFIPQGGGDHYREHRCPGEWMTIALMKRAVRLLNDTMDYRVPPQDLTVDLSAMPALPRSQFVIGDVRVLL